MRATTIGVGLLLLLSIAPGRASEPGAPLAKLLAKPDAFQTLVNPDCSHCVDEAKRRQSELRTDDRVLAWIRGKYDGGAVPVRFFLNSYRVISDTYGVWTHDPEAGYIKGYEPSLDFRFYGWRGGVMLMQHKDGTIYSCLSGRAIAGPRQGSRLKPVATLVTDWGPWLAAYPGGVAYHMFEKYQPVDAPSKPSADSLSTRGPADPRLPPETDVVGVAVGELAKAYPVALLEHSPGQMLIDELAGQKLCVVWHAATRTAAVYAARLDGPAGRTVSLLRDPARHQASGGWASLVDEQTGSHFDVAGRAVDGPLKGQTLTWLEGVQCRWFAWAAEYPETLLAAAPPDRKGAAHRPARRARRGVIVAPDDASENRLADWKRAGTSLVALLLDDATNAARCRSAADRIASAGLELHYWIEVGRNPALADAHPRWMASLGLHDDWLRRFPNVQKPAAGQVAKAYPWVPIGYRQAYDAQLARVKSLLAERAAGDYRGVLLNDLQGGPAACGCGNLQCRWAIDYGVPATATKLDGDDVAARFVADVARLAPGKQVVPVWTSECEHIDLPAAEADRGKTTGLCGGVGCATGTCPKAFARQWSALVKGHSGAIGLLALHRQFQRTGQHYPQPGAWVADAVDYLDQTPPKHQGLALPHDRLWIVIEGHGAADAERRAAESAAEAASPAVLLTSLARLDQSYEPRVLSASDGR